MVIACVRPTRFGHTSQQPTSNSPQHNIPFSLSHSQNALPSTFWHAHRIQIVARGSAINFSLIFMHIAPSPEHGTLSGYVCVCPQRISLSVHGVWGRGDALATRHMSTRTSRNGVWIGVKCVAYTMYLV